MSSLPFGCASFGLLCEGFVDNGLLLRGHVWLRDKVSKGTSYGFFDYVVNITFKGIEILKANFTCVIVDLLPHTSLVVVLSVGMYC